MLIEQIGGYPPTIKISIAPQAALNSMKPIPKPKRWQFNPDHSHIAISYEGNEVGFCAPEFATKIVEAFNENEKLLEENEILHKALYWTCLDLLRRSSGNLNQVNELRQQYMERAKRPDHGTAAIAFLLRNRQEELDISDQEFANFCNSYKLSPVELKDIYNGKEVSDSQLKALARILGRGVDELTEVRDGFTTNELRILARILGASPEEITSELTDVQKASPVKPPLKKH